MGSRSRVASTTSTSVGKAKSTNGERHPNRYASTPASSGPRNEPSALAARWNEKTRARLSMP